jgi:hypothetical protein
LIDFVCDVLVGVLAGAPDLFVEVLQHVCNVVMGQELVLAQVADLGGARLKRARRIVHDKDIKDYQVARSRRSDDEIVSRL